MKKQLFRIWHRRIGVFSLLMVLWLSLSGSLINHGDFFKFNEKTLNLPWLNTLYGLDKEIEVPGAVLLSEHYYFCYEGSLYRDEQVLSACDSQLLTGAVFHNGQDENRQQIILLNDSELLILDGSYVLFDSIPFSLLGQKLVDVVVVKDQLLVLGVDKQWRVINLLDLSLQVFDNKLFKESEPLDKSSLVDLPKRIKNKLIYTGVSVERFLLDAHSGRLFGSLGVFVVDFFAFCFVLISLSGLWLFLRKPR
jgi:hypothetical protein